MNACSIYTREVSIRRVEDKCKIGPRENNAIKPFTCDERVRKCVQRVEVFLRGACLFHHPAIGISDGADLSRRRHDHFCSMQPTEHLRFHGNARAEQGNAAEPPALADAEELIAALTAAL